jgi:hypothetical protein
MKLVRMIGQTSLLVALLVGGCSAINTGNNSGGASGKADTAACDLRQKLDSLLEEHVDLVSAATGALVAGRNEEFTAASSALDTNSQDLAGAIGSVYGTDAQNQFSTVWNKQISILIDFARGTAAKDDVQQKQATDDLIAGTKDLGALIEQLTGGKLKKDAMTELAVTHVTGLKAIIEAQAAGNFAQAYTEQRNTARYSSVIGNELTDAIVSQFPDKY